jgi:DNA-binding IclR family transcriptional regulator
MADPMQSSDGSAELKGNEVEEGAGSARKRKVRVPANHRTVDRVTQIVEEVVYHPGMTFAELARALGAPKSSVYGFIQGLRAKGWLYEQDRRFYLGPAVYGLTLASGHLRAGLVSHEDMAQLNRDTGVAAFLGVRAGDNLISIAEAGSDAIVDFEARSNVRRTLIATAAGKALLAMLPPAEVEAYLRTRGEDEQEMVTSFLNEYEDIRKTGLATNYRLGGKRFAIAACVRDKSRQVVAAVTLVGRTEDVQPRFKELSELLLKRVESWSRKNVKGRAAI